MINNIGSELKRGVFTENPVLILALGLCTTLGASTSMINGITMGVAVLFVMISSNLTISIFKKLIPESIRIHAHVTTVAIFTTIASVIITTSFPEIAKSLGIYLPLIAVNCLILGRVQSFASRNNVINSVIDAVVMGIGFTIAIVLLSAIREFLGSNSLCGYEIILGVEPISIFTLAPGGFFTIAVVIAVINSFKLKKERK